MALNAARTRSRASPADDQEGWGGGGDLHLHFDGYRVDAGEREGVDPRHGVAAGGSAEKGHRWAVRIAGLIMRAE
jgi:hypothetical protein